MMSYTSVAAVALPGLKEIHISEDMPSRLLRNGWTPVRWNQILVTSSPGSPLTLLLYKGDQLARVRHNGEYTIYYRPEELGEEEPTDQDYQDRERWQNFWDR